MPSRFEFLLVLCESICNVLLSRPSIFTEEIPLGNLYDLFAIPRNRYSDRSLIYLDGLNLCIREYVLYESRRRIPLLKAAVSVGAEREIKLDASGSGECAQTGATQAHERSAARAERRCEGENRGWKHVMFGEVPRSESEALDNTIELLLARNYPAPLFCFFLFYLFCLRGPLVRPAPH